ncbi:hypothetical protein HDU93_002506 [Gonapodya sp. JEL0774]|nr:hypothetical protein HDU93_002506 [Gonapodya sp. JEL0774]
MASTLSNDAHSYSYSNDDDLLQAVEGTNAGSRAVPPAESSALHVPRPSPSFSDNNYTTRNSFDDSRTQRALTNPDFDSILQGFSTQPDGMVQRRTSTKSAHEPMISVPRLGGDHHPGRNPAHSAESAFSQQDLTGTSANPFGLSPDSIWSDQVPNPPVAHEWDGRSVHSVYQDASRDSIDSVTTLNSTVSASDANPTTPRRSFTMPLASFARRLLSDKDLQVQYNSPLSKPPPAPISISSPTDSAPLTPISSTVVDGVRRTLGMLDLDESRTDITRAFEEPMPRKTSFSTSFGVSMSVPAGLSGMSDDSSSNSGAFGNQNYPSRTLSFATPARNSTNGTPSATGGMTRSVSNSSVTSLQSRHYPDETLQTRHFNEDVPSPEYSSAGFSNQEMSRQQRMPAPSVPSVSVTTYSGTSTYNNGVSQGSTNWTSSERDRPNATHHLSHQPAINQMSEYGHTAYPVQRSLAYSPVPDRSAPAHIQQYQGISDQQAWLYDMQAYQQSYAGSPVEYQLQRPGQSGEYGYHSPPPAHQGGGWSLSGNPVYRELSPVGVARPGTFFPLMPAARPPFMHPTGFAGHGLTPHGYVNAGPTERDGLSRDHNTPSRTLWVGSLDPNAVVADLIRIFSQFGSIESVRILPERECAFINFSRIEMAMRARREMEGAIIGSTQIRLGYGKSPDSANASPSHPVTPSPSVAVMPRSASHLGHSRGDDDMERGNGKSIWVGNLSPTVTPMDLEVLFSRYGPIESARVLAHKNCGFVNFERVEDAMEARRGLHGKEFKGSVIRISYAKVPTVRDGLEPHDFTAGDDGLSGLQPDIDPSGANRFMNRRTATPDKTGLSNLAVSSSEQPDDSSSAYASSIPPLPEPRPGRRIDQSRLRDMRKRLEGHMTIRDIEGMFIECLDEAVELCTDYIGNVVVQRLLDSTSEYHRLQFIQKIAPHMAAIGVHKNGTWVVQKIIDEAQALPQIQAISKALRRFTPPLLLDQFGNYVVQCCLKFGPTHSQFIFDAIAARTVEVGTGRFGARAIRACLESQHIAIHQQKQIAVALVHNVLILCTNPNGALLISWLLDNSNLSGRYAVVARRIVPEVTRLCCHKMGSAMVLKLVNQRAEPEGRKILVERLFGSAEVEGALEQVLTDLQYGVPTIQKILSSACVDAHERVLLADRSRLALSRIGTDVGRQRAVGYKRLLDELAVIPVGSAEGADAARNLLGYGVVAGTQYLTERGMLIPLDFGGLQGQQQSQWGTGFPKGELAGFAPAAELLNGHGDNGGHAAISENDLKEFELGHERNNFVSEMVAGTV